MARKPARSRDASDDSRRDDRLIGPGGKVSARAIVEAAREARNTQPDGLDEGEDEQLRRVRFELQHDLDKRLDKYLTDRITFLSRTQLQKLIDDGGVTVNQRIAKASTRLGAGDVVEVVVPAPPSKDIIPEDIPLEVMFEDEHLIVVNKAPDIIVHPARSHNTGTMLSALAFHFLHRSKGGLSGVGKDLARPGVVHRLDRDTSGCIVFAKTDEAHWKLGRQFEQRQVDKRYLAITHGLVEPRVFVIDLPIGPHPSREKGYREKYVVRHDELGKASVTIVRVRERYARSVASERGGASVGSDPQRANPSRKASVAPPPGAWRAPEPPPRTPAVRSANPFEADMERFSLVELELKTGRTHQIRVHLSHHLWPIVGDDMYGGRLWGAPPADADVGGAASRGAGSQAMLRTPRAQGKAARTRAAQPSEPPAALELPSVHRQCLHAATLGFQHPITGTHMVFTAPLRGDMAALVRALRTHQVHEGEPDPPGATVDLGRAVGEQR